jgi:uncharacterized damage-inducible protein DinB
MEMMQDFRRIFAYDNWANHEVIASFHAAKKLTPRSLKLMAHILAAERLWLERLQSRKQSYPVWPDFTLPQCEAEAEQLPQLWQAYLRDITNRSLEDAVSYKNSKGESWTNSVQDILMHVAMHSAYHRGQIAAELRASGNQPAYTDFIHGVRQGLVE